MITIIQLISSCVRYSLQSAKNIFSSTEVLQEVFQYRLEPSDWLRDDLLVDFLAFEPIAR